MIKCTCEDWEPNIKIINGYIDMAANRVYGNPKGYEGKIFTHCPWCGKILKDELARIAKTDLDDATKIELLTEGVTEEK